MSRLTHDQIDRSTRALRAVAAIAVALSADSADPDGPVLAAPTVAGLADAIALLAGEALIELDPTGRGA